MASIRKRNNKWQVQVRRKNYPLITQTFQSKQLALRWARKEESKFDEGYLEVFNKNCTLLDLIHRYIKEVLPKKKVCLNETISLQLLCDKNLLTNLFVKCLLRILLNIEIRDWRK